MQTKCEFINSINQINPKNWINDKTNPTTSHKFLSALEQTNCTSQTTGWTPQHAIISQNNKIINTIPLYIKYHPYGEYIFDQNLQITYQQVGLNYFPKLLSSIPFTPVTAKKFQNEPNITKIIIENIIKQTQKLNCSSLHFNFITEEETKSLQENNMLIRKTHQYHWQNKNYKNFDEFLQNLASRKRKNIKKERKYIKSLGIKHKQLQGADITKEYMDIFYEFYCLTYDRKWGSPYLSRDFFHAIRETMADEMLLIIGEYEGTAISGALNFIGDNRLIGRHWGCTQAVEFLHFETCYYQALDFACANGLEWVEAGTQGEHKLQRGYEPVFTYSAHYLLHEALHEAYGRYLEEDSHSMLDLVKHLGRYTPYRRGVGA